MCRIEKGDIRHLGVTEENINKAVAQPLAVSCLLLIRKLKRILISGRLYF
jgi:hypothetical protein